MQKSFLTRLSEQPLLADGAMGTMLLARGISGAQCLERLVLDRPEWITDIHAAYAAAGADVITSHTFGANRMRLDPHGLAGEVRTLTVRAVELARSVTGDARWVAGNVGPLGRQMHWRQAGEREAAARAFREQIEALWEAGVDLLLLETFSDPVELGLAVQAAREVCDLPLAASVTYTREGKTLSGEEVETMTRQLDDGRVDVIGANCSDGPEQLADVLSRMQATAPAAQFSVMPNAGVPEELDGRLQYPCGPAHFAAYVPAYVAHGARLIGGCCGTTPVHTQAMRKALDAQQVAAMDDPASPGPYTG